jgi:hypothetical protein
MLSFGWIDYAAGSVLVLIAVTGDKTSSLIFGGLGRRFDRQ